MYANIGELSSYVSDIPDIAWNLSSSLASLADKDTDPERSAILVAALAEYRHANSLGNDAALRKFIDGVDALLEPYLPPYTHYVAWGGESGVEFSIVPSIETLMEDARQGFNVKQVPDGEDVTVDAEGVDYVVQVNDHGNVTLFDARTGDELWACV